jgi:hypothetical protein
LEDQVSSERKHGKVGERHAVLIRYASDPTVNNKSGQAVVALHLHLDLDEDGTSHIVAEKPAGRFVQERYTGTLQIVERTDVVLSDGMLRYPLWRIVTE